MARRWQENGHNHGRSHSDTHSPSKLPVDLSAESSSVTGLKQLPLRKSQTSGSVTSTDSSSGGSFQYQHSYDVDSSNNSVGFDNHSNSSIGSSNSPLQHQHFHYVSHSPAIIPMKTSTPYIPQGVQVLPPIPSGLAGLPSTPALMPPLYPTNNSSRYSLIHGQRLLDYPHSSKVMSRGRHKAHLARARSHDGMTFVGYYNEDITDPEDEDEETQVSAV
ncbi:uncharacterized protein LOC111089914 [Limulus polyphemus]|uniref:Uncharacterized protein LOC111089914 n=1 Tax=Limulus polyphemus TaxID=6850 RepID=A0ABM1TSM5_LIMPO|nr:uncharacterized protein LOC111089914 [Limulus polyphemus]